MGSLLQVSALTLVDQMVGISNINFSVLRWATASVATHSPLDTFPAPNTIVYIAVTLYVTL
jgi:hypothetical protein